MRQRRVPGRSGALLSDLAHRPRTVHRGDRANRWLAAAALALCILSPAALVLRRLVIGPPWDPTRPVASVAMVHPQVHPHEYRRTVRQAAPGAKVHGNYARALLTLRPNNRTKSTTAYFVIGPGDRHWVHILLHALLQVLPKSGAAPPAAAPREIKATDLLAAADWNPAIVKAAFGLRPEDEDPDNGKILKGVLIEWRQCFQGPKTLVDAPAIEPDTWKLLVPDNQKAWVDYLALEFILGCTRTPGESLFEGCPNNPLQRNKRNLFSALHTSGCFIFTPDEIRIAKHIPSVALPTPARPRHPFLDIIAKYPIRPRLCKGLPNPPKLALRLDGLQSLLAQSLPLEWQPAPGVSTRDALSVVALRLARLCQRQ